MSISTPSAPDLARLPVSGLVWRRYKGWRWRPVDQSSRFPRWKPLAYAGWWSDQNLPAPVTPARVIPLMNAQRGELFAAVYLAKAQPLQRDGRGMTLEIAPFVGTPTAVVDRLASTLEAGPVVLVGDGVSDAQPLLEGVGDVRHLILSHLPPLAPVVARLAEGAADSGPHCPSCDTTGVCTPA